jgi:anti-sigma regulatory factor (Ser/Thr protein kinase)
MTGRSELRLHCVARPERAKAVRHALGAFLSALEVNPDLAIDILTAVGEAVVNVIEHAYEDDPTSPAGSVEVVALVEKTHVLCVDVFDRGTFVHRRDPRPGRGFGLRIVRAIAQDVSVNATGLGTHVRMRFDTAGEERRA